jgi:tetratricopeptide (TPR) repeat protein
VTPAAAYQRAKEAAAQALALDSGLGDAHCMLAFVKFVCDSDWTGAELEFRRALELSPGSADTYDLFGRMLSALTRHDEAIAMVTRAQELDPLAHRTDVASMLVRAGRYDEALQAATRAVEFDPDDPRGRSILGWVHLKQGSEDKGLAELERAVALAPGNTLFWAQLGQAYALVGKVGQARDVLRQLQALSRERYVSPYHLAYVYTGLGEQDAAMDLLERAHEQRSGGVYGIKGSFLFTSLHAHPRFTALLKKMNLA